MSAETILLEQAEKYIPKNYPPDLYRIRHSAAHIMAQAVLERYPVALIAIGPPVENGFYYDFQLPATPSDDDLQAIEKRMQEIMRAHHPFEVREVTADEARRLFVGQGYKLELIDGLEHGKEDEYGNRTEPLTQPTITVYRQDGFTDLCRGPHVAFTDSIDPDAVKLTSVAGAYWRGDEEKTMLTRIYGTAWRTKEELDRYLWQLAEAEKRDHRRLGKELELFHLDPTAPGMPYWLPKGLKLINTLLAFWREEHEKRGYQEIASPLINRKELYDISGHWEHYKENMFIIPISEHVTFGVKPMNCPNAMVVYNLKNRSYRDLPLRLSDCDDLHRYERSGTLHGLLRVQHFQQDDAHIFVTEAQIEEEYDRVLEIADLFYRIFGLSYTLRLGTRPSDYIGDLETWNLAEAALKRILDKHAGPGNYIVEDGDGAFYGPKIDILMDDALGRQWQMGTIQLDFQLPRRFHCTYTDKDGSEKTPVVIHRVIYGSLERFIGILIEHTAGAFPVWIAPVQATIIPITDAQLDYARAVEARLKAAGIRVEVDDSSRRMNAKIRAAQTQKIPYMLIVGKRELETGSVSVRLRTEQDLGAVKVEQFIEDALVTIREKRLI
ncbi:MAG: threonine--tRNA ligase [Caldilineaceae bacterium]